MTRRGRPPVDPIDARNQRWETTFNAAELAEVEAARGPLSRADWVLQHARAQGPSTFVVRYRKPPTFPDWMQSGQMREPAAEKRAEQMRGRGFDAEAVNTDTGAT